MPGELIIVIHGTPAPQGSKVQTPQGGLREASPNVGPWREAVRAETAASPVIGGDRPMSGALHLAVVFTLRRPASHYRTGKSAHQLKPGAPNHPGTRPDLDKLLRATLDGLVDGGGIEDDSQIVAIDAAKVYPGGHLDALDTAGAVIVIREWE